MVKEEREQEGGNEIETIKRWGNGNVLFIIYVDVKDYYFVVNIMIILLLSLTIWLGCRCFRAYDYWYPCHMACT